MGLLAASWLLLPGGCTRPSARFHESMRDAGSERKVLPGDGFLHAVYRSPGAPGPARRIYIGGDASPRRALRWIPADPTPARDVAAALFALDPGPALFLGRPCQHDLERCDPLHWTVGRYSEEIVDSMVAALRAHWEREGGTPASFELVGWSGGGTIALLMAEELRSDGLARVVTVAGNLDVAAWTRHHGTHPLSQSLDPAKRAPVGPPVDELHLFGDADRVMPPELGVAAARARGRVGVRVLPEVSHSRGWTQFWPGALEEDATPGVAPP